MSKECPEPRKPRCRNCEEMGHIAKECPKPRDSMSLVHITSTA
jgi:hypothetical protein